MKKTKVNILIKEIESAVGSNLFGHYDYCKALNKSQPGSCNCGFDHELDEIMNRLRELRAELGIWDK